MIGLDARYYLNWLRKDFRISSKTAVFPFIIAFGITKAICSILQENFANLIGRKNLLVIGWLFALPVPLS